MPTGKLKWYNETKGFGFIETSENKDIFVHRSGLANPTKKLAEGQEVSFDIERGPKGISAINVK